MKLRNMGISVLLFFFLTGCNGEKELLNNVSQRSANEIISILQKHGIESAKVANKKSNTFLITTDNNNLSKSIRVLAEYGYPKKKETNLQELFKKEGLVSSPLEDKVRYLYGLEVGIQDTLSQIDGVITAKVHIVIPDNDPFQEKITPSSAAVFIKHRSSVNLNSLKTSIKILVEKSIAGLTYDKVSLVLIPAGQLEPISEDAAQSVSSSSSTPIIILVALLLISWLLLFLKKAPNHLREKFMSLLPLNHSPSKSLNKS